MSTISFNEPTRTIETPIKKTKNIDELEPTTAES
jgi:hypothetical protein